MRKRLIVALTVGVLALTGVLAGTNGNAGEVAGSVDAFPRLPTCGLCLDGFDVS